MSVKLGLVKLEGGQPQFGTIGPEDIAVHDLLDGLRMLEDHEASPSLTIPRAVTDVGSLHSAEPLGKEVEQLLVGRPLRQVLDLNLAPVEVLLVVDELLLVEVGPHVQQSVLVIEVGRFEEVLVGHQDLEHAVAGTVAVGPHPDVDVPDLGTYLLQGESDLTGIGVARETANEVGDFFGGM